LDSCEQAFDTPLLYEGGWGKKLNYVIAISKEDWVDVTPRYTLNRLMTRMRRTIVSEDWLALVLKTQRERLWEMQGEQRARVLRERYQREEAELMNGSGNDRQVSQEELVPRQSGALEWRQQRGEIGSGAIP
jgi:peptide-N4-(N-acetyl-beta-glucosaminyl)asparagine amidase